MADEDQKAADQSKEPAVADKPALDADALGVKIGAEVQRNMQVWLANAVKEQPVRAEPEPLDALEQVVSPVIHKTVGPHVQAATLIAASAADKADFYTVNDAEELSERNDSREEVERRFEALARVGRATPRIDIWHHLKGEQDKQFAERRRKKAEERQKARDEALDVEGVPRAKGSAPKGVPQTADEAYAVSQSGEGALDKKLEGVTF